ncbi:MAG: exodeoxyribonuclease VII small subunit [Alphaproteobacteria bacterium]|nr:exodeoxyribonuclease VII small subunit [Alphaproteobacteria bacterium]
MSHELTFEQALSELEEIIKKLEDGRMPLNEAVTAFERGSYLTKFCEEQLKNAQLKIEMLTGSEEQK